MDYSPPTEADRAWYRIVGEYLSQTTQREANGRVPKLLKSSEEFGLMLPADMHRRAIHACLASEFRTMESFTGRINFIDDDDGSDQAMAWSDVDYYDYFDQTDEEEEGEEKSGI